MGVKQGPESLSVSRLRLADVDKPTEGVEKTLREDIVENGGIYIGLDEVVDVRLKNDSTLLWTTPCMKASS